MPNYKKWWDKVCNKLETQERQDYNCNNWKKAGRVSLEATVEQATETKSKDYKE